MIAIREKKIQTAAVALVLMRPTKRCLCHIVKRGNQHTDGRRYRHTADEPFDRCARHLNKFFHAFELHSAGRPSFTA